MERMLLQALTLQVIKAVLEGPVSQWVALDRLASLKDLHAQLSWTVAPIGVF